MVQPSTQDEAELEQSRAPLLDHLIELRGRLIKSIVAFFLAFVVCYVFAGPIYQFLTQPLADAMSGQAGRRLIFTELYETFFTYVKVGMFGGICIAFPYIAVQIWAFIAPGLYRHERNAFLPFLVATPVMFFVGASFVYYLMLPNVIPLLLSFETPGGNGTLPIELEAKVSSYLSFVMTLIFAFGLCFELPVLVTLLGRVGIVTAEQLKLGRRYAIVGIVVIAAIVTPPDVFSQLALAFPMVLLYEISIWLVWLIEKKRDEKERAEDLARGLTPRT